MQRSVSEWAAAAAGAGEQGIEAVEGLGTSGESALGLGFVGQIGGDPDQLGLRSESLCQREAVVLLQRHDEEPRPFCGEPHRGGFGDAGRPRDSTDLSGETPGDVWLGHVWQASIAMSTNCFTDLE